LPDHDWEVDGPADGSTGIDGGAADRRPGREKPDPPTANVVPFPGNWFGSIDELVPIHSETGARQLTPIGDGAAPPPESTAEPTPDASAFWEGEAAPLQRVVAAPTDPASPLVDADLIPEPETAETGDAPQPRRRVRAPALAVLVLAAAAAGVLLVVHVIPVGPGSRAARDRGLTAAASARHAKQVVTQTVTSPVRTVTTTILARTHRHGARAGTDRTKPTGTLGSASKTARGTSTVPGSPAPQQPSATDLATPHETSSSSSGSSEATTNRSSGHSGSRCAGAVSPDSGCLP
jgi:hypothetical protein